MRRSSGDVPVAPAQRDIERCGGEPWEWRAPAVRERSVRLKPLLPRRTASDEGNDEDRDGEKNRDERVRVAGEIEVDHGVPSFLES